MEITTHEALIIISALQSSPWQTANTAWWEFPRCASQQGCASSTRSRHLPGRCLERTSSLMHLLSGAEAPPAHSRPVICGTFGWPLAFEGFTYCSCDGAIPHDWQYSCAGSAANGAPNPFLPEEMRLQVPWKPAGPSLPPRHAGTGEIGAIAMFHPWPASRDAPWSGTCLGAFS